MKLTKFLADKFTFILTQSFIIIFIFFALERLHVNFELSIFISLSILIITLLQLFYEYFKRNQYYGNLYSILKTMDKKQYIAQMINEPDFADGEILYDVLKQTTKAMNDEIFSYKVTEEEYYEYIQTWIHEIKLPISCISLICENNKNEVTQGILDETNRIDAFVEQALYYARSTNVEKDYSVRSIELDSFIKSVIKKHSKQLIGCKAELKIENLSFIIYSDPKWLDFILGQFLSNSIRYRKEPFKLLFSAEETQTNVVLYIQDNGIGIPEKDLSRVFEKGFTGENGRKYTKSTGIGLYLCKRLCDKMHLGLELASNENLGTTIKITFPKDKSIIFEN